jgi:hypothetical protein
VRYVHNQSVSGVCVSCRVVSCDKQNRTVGKGKEWDTCAVLEVVGDDVEEVGLLPVDGAIAPLGQLVLGVLVLAHHEELAALLATTANVVQETMRHCSERRYTRHATEARTERHAGCVRVRWCVCGGACGAYSAEPATGWARGWSGTKKSRSSMLGSSFNTKLQK